MQTFQVPISFLPNMITDLVFSIKIEIYSGHSAIKLNERRGLG